MPFESFPSRAVRDHGISAVGDRLMVWGNLIETKAVPNDITPDELNVETAIEVMAVPDVIKLGHHPENGLPVFVRDGKFGPLRPAGRDAEEGHRREQATDQLPVRRHEDRGDDAGAGPRSVDHPPELGTDPNDGLPITARNGPHGPYLTKPPAEEGKRGDTRSFDDEHKLLTMTLDEAVALFAQPKRGRGQRNTGPLKELGVDPTTDLPVVVRNGQFGEYVTDGEVNASLTATDSVERIDITRASELLATRRAKIAAEGGAPTKKATKKSAKKSSKKAAKKSARKRAAAKRT